MIPKTTQNCPAKTQFTAHRDANGGKPVSEPVPEAEAANGTLKAPFPYFGGKSPIAPLVWTRLGDVPNFIEPFFGSGAVLLSRPHPPQLETVNDLDGLLCNFWRAIKADPGAVAEHADWPVNENDLHARHIWLVGQRESLTARLEGDPEYYDAKAAGWWCWGVCCWIGSGWCSGNGPWKSVDGMMTNTGEAGGIKRQLVHLGSKGLGVNRKRVHLGSEWSDGVGIVNPNANIYEWFRALSDRLRRVQVCSGDWSRVCGPTPTTKHGLTGVFLDPPYADTAKRSDGLYAKDSLSVAHDVREWAIANGDNPLMRIALCGYEGEHEMPDSWECVAWKAHGGYGSRTEKGLQNAHKERIWFNKYCLKGGQISLW